MSAWPANRWITAAFTTAITKWLQKVRRRSCGVQCGIPARLTILAKVRWLFVVQCPPSREGKTHGSPRAVPCRCCVANFAEQSLLLVSLMELLVGSDAPRLGQTLQDRIACQALVCSSRTMGMARLCRTENRHECHHHHEPPEHSHNHRAGILVARALAAALPRIQY